MLWISGDGSSIFWTNVLCVFCVFVSKEKDCGYEHQGKCLRL